MRKLFKIIFIVVAFLVCVVVITSLALRFMFPSARLRQAVEHQIRNKTNREAQIGDIQLGLRGITLSQLKLSEVPSFSKAGEFAAVEKVDVRWSLMPLLDKHMELKAVIAKPTLTIVRLADGKTLNVHSLPGQTSGSAPAPKAPATPSTTPPAEKSDWTFKITSVELKDGTIRFVDRSPARQTSTLSGIHLLVKDFDGSQATARLSVKRLENPVYTASDFSMAWTLRNIDSTLARLSGNLQMKQGPGLVQNLTSLVGSSKRAKVALMPLVTLQSLDRLGFVKLGLPNFSRLDIQNIDGRYTFQEGKMNIDMFQINSQQATIGATGTVQLASEKLNVNVSMHTPEPVLMGEMDLKMSVTGTLSDPKTNLDHLKKKAFKATVNQILGSPEAQKTIKKLFR